MAGQAARWPAGLPRPPASPPATLRHSRSSFGTLDAGTSPPPTGPPLPVNPGPQLIHLY
jgi:hypothetical protein